MSFWIAATVDDTDIPLAAADHYYILWVCIFREESLLFRDLLRRAYTSPNQILTVTFYMKKNSFLPVSWRRRNERQHRRSKRHRSGLLLLEPSRTEPASSLTLQRWRQGHSSPENKRTAAVFKLIIGFVSQSLLVFFSQKVSRMRKLIHVHTTTQHVTF